MFDCYRSICSDFFSIILLLKKNFEEKNPNYLNYIIATGSNDFTNLCLFNSRCIFKLQWRSTLSLYCYFMANVLIVFLFSYVYHN